MRLTHLCEYKDKRKNKEPMLKIRNKLFNYENIEEKHNIRSFDDLDNRLIALKIIEKKKVDTFIFSHSGNLETYNDMVEDNRKLTQEYFDLLKEVLGYEKN